MGLRIATNMASISAQKVLQKQQKRAEHAAAALSSGSRIVNAADDAAGLAISESLRGQIRGIGQARNNAFNSISAIQVSEGGLNEISNILVRLRELGVQAASDHIGDRERQFLNLEAKNMTQELDRIARTTVFGDKKLLDGSGGSMTFQVGAFAGEENTITYDLDSNATGSELGVDGLAMETKNDATDSLQTVDEALVKDRINAR